MIKEMKISEFYEVLSSKAPVPGGGGASALGGALGAALGSMVGNLTVGKKRYADVEEEVQDLLKQLEALGKDMMILADRDAEVFAPLAASYGLPSETPEQKAEKEIVLEKNLLAASLVPLEIMEKSVEIMEILKILAEKGSRMAVSDVGVAVQFARAALLGAVMNVYINTKSMKNREKAEELNAHAAQLVKAGTAEADKIYEGVTKTLTNR
ncbi:sugar ABC transporter substrate-binding protein [Clostridium sp. chh4-2]|uniref:cyclodeaminase/cyclohydrolase family protein n=1 Tax=Clostridium sp. chh4-2 TaxID=2067550 RepID=UPI000CCFA803|nr:cyclodeaminase/cyclohydrolase family protein [Clostridium sp. chh4-2]PNV59365.1 sugar ABC transporter substrate-binding protein [Clostridium sp. chh4-2]